MLPINPPMEHRTNEKDSVLTFMNNMAKVAAVSPADWTISPTSLAIIGWTSNASVITGKAIAAPPNPVIPNITTNSFLKLHRLCIISIQLIYSTHY